MSELIDREALKDAVKRYAGEPIKEKDRKCQAICLDMLGIIDAQPTASPWHRVEEELPSMDGYDWVLGVVTGEAGYLRFHKAVMMVSFDPQYKEWFIDEYPDARITVSHWMLLPEPPKEDA